MRLFRFKIDLLKAEAVAKMKLTCTVLCDNFYHIGHRKRTGFISLGVIQIKHLIHIFKGFTDHLTLKYLVINAAVNLRTALKLGQALIIHKGDVVGIPLQIDLINSYIQRS